MTHDTPSDAREHRQEQDVTRRDREVVAQLESALASATVRRERRTAPDERG